MFTKNQSLSTDLSTAIPQERSVFAIFVHFGPSETTNAAIESLLRGIVPPDHIIVVDHSDVVMPDLIGHPQALDSRRSLPPATIGGGNDIVSVIRPEQNTGYFGGLQAGINQARILGAREEDLCLLLNNDVVFFDTSLATILTWWKAHGTSQVLAGASGGYVSLFSGRATIGSKKKRNTPWNIPYVHGSCMIGEFGLLSQLAFPAHLFLYWEDVALSMMIHRSGGRLAVIPGLRIGHNDALSPVSLSKLFYLVRNGAYVLEHYASLPWRMYWYVANTLRRAHHAAQGGMQHDIAAKALRAARVGMLGKADI